MGKIYVLDQNVLQRAGLREFIAREHEAKYVLPDTALVEMTKSDQWQYTFRRGFAVLRPIVTRCFMSMSVQEAMNLELEGRRSINGYLLPIRFRELLRGAIVGSQQPDGNATIESIRGSIAEVRQELQQNELNVAAVREELVARVEELKSHLSEDQVRGCKDRKSGRFKRLTIAVGVGDGMYRAHMRRLGVPSSVASRLKSQQCMTLRWTYMLAHHALQWLGDGGIEQAGDKTVVNDVLDQDYVLTASFFTDVVTFEQDVRDALIDLRFMLSLRQTPVELA